MNQPCPSADQWLRRLDGEVTANRLAELDAHAATCGACSREATRLDRLAADLRAPSPGAAAEAVMVSRVMARLDDPAPAGDRARWPWLAGGFALAAALALVIALPGSHRADPATFEARGGGALGLEQQLGIELYSLGREGPTRPAGTLTPVANGTRVSRDTPYVASYRNLRGADVYALVFALDADGEVHWLYPAYTDAATDPAAVRVTSTRAPVLFPETVVLDRPALGPMSIAVIVRDRPLHVSDIEHLGRDARTPAALRVRWPDAVIRTIAVDVQ